MANFQHLKASRTRVLDTFPAKNFGNDGDIVISRISGRGVFICTKAGGMWYVANQMQELSRIGKTTIKDLTTDNLTVKEIANTEESLDNYLVNDLGKIKFKTGKQVVNDLTLPINNISYKQAYCSLERYTDQETCEANGGTWYYSTNDTHDSISSTAENQLLTIGQMHNSVDTEPTLLYDGSVLEIKRNTDFDDNWQSAANIHTLKLSYNSSLNSTLGTDSFGNLRITSTSTHTSGTLLINNIEEIGSDTDKFLMSDSGVVKFVTGANLRSYIGAGTGDGDITGVSITTDTGAGSKAEDTGGSADFSILGSSGVGVTNSGTTITAVAVPAEIDHDSLNNFVANEHVDHTSITLTAGDGLTGGGDISANRSFAVSVDDSTIEINSDSLRVKDDGITYAKLQNVTDARMLGNNAGSDGVVTEMTKANVLSFLNVADGAEANVSGDSGNAAIYDNSGTPAFKSGITKAEVLSLLNVADGAGVAPTNFVTNDADDTMAGTLTIDKNNTATSTANVRGLLVDFDHTGISASGQTINNISIDVALRSDGVTHVGAVNNYGVRNTLIGGTSGTQTNYGIYNAILGADNNIGIYQNIVDGGTDLKFVSSANADDFFAIQTFADGETIISTTEDGGGQTAHLTLDVDGDIILDADGGNVYIKDNGSTLIQLANNAVVVGEVTYGNNLVQYDGDDLLAYATEELTITNYLKIGETANANSDTEARGQIWVKNDTPNCLAFTDDAGTDIIGVGKYHYETKTIGFFAGQTSQFLPITGYIFERTTSAGQNEFIGFIPPYNCRLEKFCFRSEIAQNGTMILRVYEAQDGTESPGTQIYRKDHSIDIADDTFLELDMTSPGIGSDYAPMTKGRIYGFFLTTPSNGSDTNVSLVLRHDITS